MMPLLIFIIVFPAIMLVSIYSVGLKLSEPEKSIKSIPGGLTEAQKQIIVHYRDWLASLNLEYRASYQFGSIQSIVFQQGDRPRFLNFMFAQKLIFSAESYCEDLTVLDTSASSNPSMFPRPGAYIQSFPNMPLPELWQRHLEAEAYLSKKFGYTWSPFNRPYLDILVDAIRLRMKYTRQKFFWPVAVLYRFATGRSAIRRPISQQYP